MLHPFITTKTIKDNRSESVRTDSHLFFAIKFAQEKGKNYICTNKQLKSNVMSIKQSILNDIRAEKLCSTPDKHHIQRCQKILDNLESLTYEKFINTGHIMPKGHIIDRYPHRKLKEDTKTVCRYVGGFCIEFVGKDDFFWGYHKDKDFKHVEMTLYNHVKNTIDER